MGHSTLHMDTAKYYGGEWAAFTWDGLQEWLGEGEQEDVQEAENIDFSLQEGEELIQFGKKKTIVNIVEKWNSDSSTENQTPLSDNTPYDDQIDNDAIINEDEPQEGPAQTIMKDPKPVWNKETLKLQSRKFNLDLTPRLLFARGPMVELLISSNISRYTEFKSVTRVLTLLDGKLEQVPSSRSDVFNTKHISVVEKRVLMKFLTQCLQEEEGEEESDKTFGDFLKVHKLTPNLTHFVVHSIAMTHPESPQAVGLKATRKFLSSLGRFGPTPFLWSMYGTGELPQAFCRLCAVFGGVYYLGRSLEGLVVKEGTAQAVVTEGRRIQCDQVVLPAALVPAELRLEDEGTGVGSCSRAVLLSKASMLPTEKEQLTFLSMPKNQDGSRKSALHLIEVSSGTAACPKGLHMLHASSAGEVDLVSEVKGLVASDLIYSISWQQEEQTACNCSTTLSNTFLAAGPRHELDLTLAIEAARSVHKKLYPEEDFLPRAPDPEEILIGGEDESDEAKRNDTNSKEAESGTEGEENQGTTVKATDEQTQDASERDPAAKS